LVVVQGRPEGQEIPVSMGEFLIGRDSRCNLCPSSAAASRMHCKIVQRGGSVVVQDLGSTNGTLVNGERIDGELEVFDGDQLQVGSLAFRFKIESAWPVTEPAMTPLDELARLRVLGSKTPTTLLKIKPKAASELDSDTQSTDETRR
jgi:pSer/pThr/pTyr-binding forkhead associated (FHA) protein